MTALFAIGLVVIATLFSGFSPIFLKKGAAKFSVRALLRNPFSITRQYLVVIGVLFDVIAAMLNVVALRFGELSVLTPVTALTYVWACFFSVRLLNERMTRRKWAGVAFIVAGVVLVTLGRTA